MFYVVYEYLDPSDDYFEWITDESGPFDSSDDAHKYAASLSDDYANVSVTTESYWDQQSHSSVRAYSIRTDTPVDCPF